jgi:hypothetical protein
LSGHILSLRAFAALFALVAPAIASAQSACTLIAQKALAGDLHSSSLAGWPFLKGVAERSEGLVAIGVSEFSGTVGTVEEHVRRSYQISPQLSDAFAQIASYGTGWAADLSRFGETKSGLRMVQSAQGTAYCQVFVFFDVAADGSAQAIADPPGAQPGRLCSTTSGSAIEVLGTPTFMVEDRKLPEDNVVVALTPWQRGSWQRTCRIAFKFSHVFRAADRSCRGVDCPRIEAEVLRQVERLDRQEPPSSSEPPVEREKVEKMTALAKDYAERFLPSLPRDTAKLFESSFIEFRDPAFVPFVFESETYLAQIGHGVYRYVTSPDYLFAAYRLAEDRLEPVASFYVRKERDRLLSATVD